MLGLKLNHVSKRGPRSQNHECVRLVWCMCHYSDVIMSMMASWITSLTHDWLPKRLFGRTSKKTSKLHVTGLCEGNSPVTSEFPVQRASNAENVSIWWHHHVYFGEKCYGEATQRSVLSSAASDEYFINMMRYNIVQCQAEHSMSYIVCSQFIWLPTSCNPSLTHKQLEMYWCILSTVATDALVLKHQAISIQNTN